MTLLRPTRRDLIRLAAVAPAFSLKALPARGNIGAPFAANPGFFRFTIGQAKLTVISDGHFEVPVSTVGVNADEADKLRFLEQYHLSQTIQYNHANHLYIEIGEARVLVDIGSGSRVFETTGKLIDNMEAAGIDPFEITHVLFTHAHPDHIWGIRDDFDEAVLPDAEYVMGQKEHRYWLQDDLVNQVDETLQSIVVGAVNSIQADGVDWRLVGPDEDIVPGIRMVATEGHTDGHMSVVVESEGKQLIALGDAMTHVFMNFARPDWLIQNDQFPERTVKTRHQILDMASADNMVVLGYHFPFPGLGHVSKINETYQFIPALWRW